MRPSQIVTCSYPSLTAAFMAEQMEQLHSWRRRSSSRSKPPSVHLAQHLLHLLRHGSAMTSPSIKHKPHVHKRFSAANRMLVTFSSAKTYRPNSDHELMPRWDLNCAFATSFWCLQKLIRTFQRSKKYQQQGHAAAGSNVRPALPGKK